MERFASLEVEQRRMNSLVRENERLRIQVQQLKYKIKQHGVEGMKALEEIGVLLGTESIEPSTSTSTGTPAKTTV
tara:strand:+ start:841 stop:1065 length:225 start_codon:yes stop_codon:yes gene_type:complete